MDASHEILDPYVEPPEQAGSRPHATRYASSTGRSLRRIAIVVALALIAGFLFMHHERSNSSKQLAAETQEIAAQAPGVETVVARAMTGPDVLVLPGATAAWDEATIYARVNGYVAKWLVDIGDQVKSGQTLALIYTPDLDAELLAAKAKLNAATAQVAVAQAKATFATTSYERWRDSPKGVVSDQEREDKQAAKAAGDAELMAARAQVALQQADVDRLTALTEFKQVKAPFDGAVVERQINTGDLVTAGSTANTRSLYRVVQDDPLRVFVSAPQNTATELMAPDVKALVTFGDRPGAPIEGKVARTSGTIDPRSRTLRVEIDLPNADHKLVPGMYVKVEFRLKSRGGVQVPAAALVFRSDGPYVAVVDSASKVEFRKIAISRDDGTVVTVGSGLAEGDQVVLNISSQISAGQTVKVQSAGSGEKTATAQ